MFAFIFKVIKAVFKFIYKILSVLNLQFALLVALLGIVLYITGVLSSNGVILLLYCLVFIASVVAAVIITVCKLLGISKEDNKKDKKKKKVEIVKDEQENKGQDSEQPLVSQPVMQVQSVSSPYPRYYNVKQNKNYVMAEYEDRYELYLRTQSGLSKVRTDYK